MTWNIFLVSGDIINVVVLDAALASLTAVIRGSVQLVAIKSDSTSGSPAQVICLLFLGLLGSRSALNSKNINNNGFNSDNSDVLPVSIWRLWSRNFSS